MCCDVVLLLWTLHRIRSDQSHGSIWWRKAQSRCVGLNSGSVQRFESSFTSTGNVSATGAKFCSIILLSNSSSCLQNKLKTPMKSPCPLLWLVVVWSSSMHWYFDLKVHCLNHQFGVCLESFVVPVLLVVAMVTCFITFQDVQVRIMYIKSFVCFIKGKHAGKCHFWRLGYKKMLSNTIKYQSRWQGRRRRIRHLFFNFSLHWRQFVKVSNSLAAVCLLHHSQGRSCNVRKNEKKKKKRVNMNEGFSVPLNSSTSRLPLSCAETNFGSSFRGRWDYCCDAWREVWFVTMEITLQH